VHHGAAEGVTGSCHRLEASDNAHYLIDCGLFQGNESLAMQQKENPQSSERALIHTVNFDISQIKALVLTHVHLDHVGRLPYLLAAGFHQPIYCSRPSAALLPLVIEDALKVGFTHNYALIHQCLQRISTLLVPLDYDSWRAIPADDNCSVRLKLHRAGHILGSAFAEFDIRYPDRSHCVIFSGDLGAPYTPLLPAPRSPYGADTLVLETTYGDRCHEHRHSRKQRLRSAIEHALENNGTVMIPAFSIGRTQELLYELESLIRQGEHQGSELWKNLEVIVDSPLAAKFTRVFRELQPYWDAEARRRLKAGRHPLSFENLLTIDSHEAHVQTVDYLVKTGRPAVVLAASGMASGGRIMNYLKAMIDKPQHAVLFVGYQAKGTCGHTIQTYGNREGAWVDIGGTRYSIRARVETISGYSAHADQKDLLRFVKRMRQWPKTIHLVHGDCDAQKAFKAKLQQLARENNHDLSVVMAQRSE